MVNAKQKGANGEREVASLLQPVVDRAYMETLGITQREVPKLQRNLLQTREGGYDLVGLDWLALEVKRVEAVGASGQIRKGALRGWWLQCVTAASKREVVDGQVVSRVVKEPVLFYRPNGVTWTVRMYGHLSIPDVNMGSFGVMRGKRVKAPVTVELEPFLVWLDLRIRHELQGAGLGVQEQSV